MEHYWSINNVAKFEAEDGSIIPEIIDQEIMEEKATDKKIVY